MDNTSLKRAAAIKGSDDSNRIKEKEGRDDISSLSILCTVPANRTHNNTLCV